MGKKRRTRQISAVVCSLLLIALTATQQGCAKEQSNVSSQHSQPPRDTVVTDLPTLELEQHANLLFDELLNDYSSGYKLELSQLESLKIALQELERREVAIAYELLGEAYRMAWFGTDPRTSYKKAEDYLVQNEEAQESSGSAYLLGRLYLLGVPPVSQMEAGGQVFGVDYTQAKKWYEVSAERGEGYAEQRLGEMYESGLGVDVNLSKAVHYYERAHKRGVEDARENASRCRGKMNQE